MIDHKLMGVGAGALAHLGIECDIAAQQGLQAGAEGADDAAGTDDDAADDPEGFCGAVAWKFKPCSYELRIYGHTFSSQWIAYPGARQFYSKWVVRGSSRDLLSRGQWIISGQLVK